MFGSLRLSLRGSGHETVHGLLGVFGTNSLAVTLVAWIFGLVSLLFAAMTRCAYVLDLVSYKVPNFIVSDCLACTVWV